MVYDETVAESMSAAEKKKEGKSMKMKLQLGDLGSVKKFVNITSQYSDEISLVRDHYIIDAKSILGIFSMDLTRPVDLVCDRTNDSLRHDLHDFVIA